MERPVTIDMKKMSNQSCPGQLSNQSMRDRSATSPSVKDGRSHCRLQTLAIALDHTYWPQQTIASNINSAILPAVGPNLLKTAESQLSVPAKVWRHEAIPAVSLFLTNCFVSDYAQDLEADYRSSSSQLCSDIDAAIEYTKAAQCSQRPVRARLSGRTAPDPTNVRNTLSLQL
jgi:hypothetical protein